MGLDDSRVVEWGFGGVASHMISSSMGKGYPWTVMNETDSRFCM